MIYLPRIAISVVTPTSTAFRTAVNSMFMIEPLNRAILECMHEEPRDSGDCDMVILKMLGPLLARLIVEGVTQNALVSDFIKLFTVCTKLPNGREFISREATIDNISRIIVHLLTLINHPHINKTIMVRRCASCESGAIVEEYCRELQSITEMKTAGGRITRLGAAFIVILPSAHELTPIRYMLTCGPTVYVPNVIYESVNKKIVAYVATERVD